MQVIFNILVLKNFDFLVNILRFLFGFFDCKVLCFFLVIAIENDWLVFKRLKENEIKRLTGSAIIFLLLLLLLSNVFHLLFGFFGGRNRIATFL